MAASSGPARRLPLRSIGLLVYVFVVTMLGTTLPTPLSAGIMTGTATAAIGAPDPVGDLLPA